jgi:hypothetical protein
MLQSPCSSSCFITLYSEEKMKGSFITSSFVTSLFISARCWRKTFWRLAGGLLQHCVNSISVASLKTQKTWIFKFQICNFHRSSPGRYDLVFFSISKLCCFFILHPFLFFTFLLLPSFLFYLPPYLFLLLSFDTLSLLSISIFIYSPFHSLSLLPFSLKSLYLNLSFSLFFLLLTLFVPSSFE